MESPYKVLIVDDNPTNVGILAASLKKGGYDVTTASSGRVAIKLAVAHRPDAVLLDMQLPDTDGLEVCKTLKATAQTASVPVIFVTAVSDAHAMLEAFEAGGSDYVTKPFRIAEILARVSVHAKLHRAEAALRETKQQTEKRAEELAEANVQLVTLSRRDPLTDLLNRRAWEDGANQEHERFDRHGTTYSIMIIDVDQFKNFNDTLGHQSGDVCLQGISQAIVSTCRSLDLVGRLGGEEFVVLAPETGIDAGLRLGERIRKAIWALGILHPASSVAERVTVSTGVASAGAGTWADVLKRADAAMYVAKRAGRNMVYADHQSRQLEDELTDHGSPSASVMGVAALKDSRPSVLIVDDNQADRALFRRCLEREDCLVREAADGAEALPIVTQDPPDVIILDVLMPNMDGLACAKRLRADPDARDIPILLVSACSDSPDVVAGLEVGADGYLVKPVQPNELVARVQAMARMNRERAHLLQSYAFRSEQTRTLRSLLDYSRVVGSSGDLDEILTHTVEVTAEVTSSRRVSVMLPESDRRFLRIAKAIGVNEEVARTVRVPVGEMIGGYVFAHRQAVVINDQKEARFQRHPYDSSFFASVPLASTPLGLGAETIGVLNVTDRFGRRPFEPNHIESIDLIAGIAGAAINRILNRKVQNRTCDSTMLALAKLAEHREYDTGRHLERVTRYCLILAEELQTRPDVGESVDDAFICDIQRAVPLHDIGKVAIPDEILCKPGRLTHAEREVMQSHASVGAAMIRSFGNEAEDGGFLKMAADVAEAHHEWYNGSGYPRGVTGRAIPLAARITALADVYDALTTSRAYKDAVSTDKAASIIAELSGTHFDPIVADAFQTRQQEFAQVSVELIDQGSSAESVQQMALASAAAVADVGLF